MMTFLYSAKNWFCLATELIHWDLVPAAAAVIAIQKGKLQFLAHFPPFSYPTEDICVGKNYHYRSAICYLLHIFALNKI